MTITLISEEQIQERLKEFHVLTYAEPGFAPLDIHGRLHHGLSAERLGAFANEVNRRGESGSLYPEAPISAVPREFIRDIEDAVALAAQIVDFLKANGRTIHAKRLLCDFRTPNVAPYVFVAIGLALGNQEATKGIVEVVIIVA